MYLPVRAQGDQMDVAGVAVQERRLGRGREQPLRLPLAVMLDQTGAELRERGCGRELAPDPRGRSPVPGDRPREDHLAVFRPIPRLVGRVEPSLHPGGAASSRTSEAEPLSPRASNSPTVTIVLPAPVSPVRTFRPGPSSSSRSAITPSPLMWSSRSTARMLALPPDTCSPDVRRIPGGIELVPDAGEEPGPFSFATNRAGRGAAWIRTFEPTGS